MIIYIQIYMLYDSKTIKFDLIIYNVINKKRHMLAVKENNIIIFIYRNNKNKQFVKSGSDDSDFINHEIYISYKTVNRKFKYPFIKC